MVAPDTLKSNRGSKSHSFSCTLEPGNKPHSFSCTLERHREVLLAATIATLPTSPERSHGSPIAAATRGFPLPDSPRRSVSGSDRPLQITSSQAGLSEATKWPSGAAEPPEVDRIGCRQTTSVVRSEAQLQNNAEIGNYREALQAESNLAVQPSGQPQAAQKSQASQRVAGTGVAGAGVPGGAGAEPPTEELCDWINAQLEKLGHPNDKPNHRHQEDKLDHLNDNPNQQQLPVSESDVEFQKMLGSGVFGNVWSATWKCRPVAAKVTDCPTGFRPEELLMLRAAQGPHTVKLLAEVNTVKGMAIIMQLCGGSLQDQLSERKDMQCTVREFLESLLQIASGLMQLHAKQILYNDLKPDNILLGSNGELLFADFGDARDLSVSTRGKSVHELGWGSPNYHARPDVMAMELTEASDTWMLAQTMIHIWSREGAATNPSTVPLQLPLRKLIVRCLSLNPAERPTAANLAACAQQEITSLASNPGQIEQAIETEQAAHSHLLEDLSTMKQRLAPESQLDDDILNTLHKAFGWLTANTAAAGFWFHPRSFQPDAIWSGVLWQVREILQHFDGLLDHETCEQLVESPYTTKVLQERLNTKVSSGKRAVLQLVVDYWKQVHIDDRRYDTALIAAEMVTMTCPRDVLAPPMGTSDGELFHFLIAAMQVLIGAKPVPLAVPPQAPKKQAGLPEETELART